MKIENFCLYGERPEGRDLYKLLAFIDYKGSSKYLTTLRFVPYTI